MIDTEYFINDGCMNHKIEKLANIKDLSVIFDSEVMLRLSKRFRKYQQKQQQNLVILFKNYHIGLQIV